MGGTGHNLSGTSVNLVISLLQALWYICTANQFSHSWCWELQLFCIQYSSPSFIYTCFKVSLQIKPTACQSYSMLTISTTFLVILLFLMPKEFKLPHLWIIFMCACICIYKYTHVRLRTMTWPQPKNTETFKQCSGHDKVLYNFTVWSHCPLIMGNSKS